jgi:hypothetical protein
MELVFVIERPEYEIRTRINVPSELWDKIESGSTEKISIADKKIIKLGLEELSSCGILPLPDDSYDYYRL